MAKAAKYLSLEELTSRHEEIQALQAEVRSHVASINELFSDIARIVRGGTKGKADRVGRKPKRAGRPRGRPAVKRGAIRRGARKSASRKSAPKARRIAKRGRKPKKKVKPSPGSWGRAFQLLKG